jgi:mxaK protein
MHRGFAILALVCVAWAAVQGWRLADTLRTNATIARVSASADAARSLARTDQPARIRLARAVALSKAGADNEATKLYSELISNASRDDISRAALFNLANLYLREAMAAGTHDAIKSGPLIELAKARYRDLLRENPDDWGARYNLERALWLQPETADAFDDSDRTPVMRRSVNVRDLPLGDLP